MTRWILAAAILGGAAFHTASGWASGCASYIVVDHGPTSEGTVDAEVANHNAVGRRIDAAWRDFAREFSNTQACFVRFYGISKAKREDEALALVGMRVDRSSNGIAWNSSVSTLVGGAGSTWVFIALDATQTGSLRGSVRRCTAGVDSGPFACSAPLGNVGNVDDANLWRRFANPAEDPGIRSGSLPGSATTIADTVSCTAAASGQRLCQRSDVSWVENVSARYSNVITQQLLSPIVSDLLKVSWVSNEMGGDPSVSARCNGVDIAKTSLAGMAQQLVLKGLPLAGCTFQFEWRGGTPAQVLLKAARDDLRGWLYSTSEKNDFDVTQFWPVGLRPFSLKAIRSQLKKSFRGSDWLWWIPSESPEVTFHASLNDAIKLTCKRDDGVCHVKDDTWVEVTPTFARGPIGCICPAEKVLAYTATKNGETKFVPEYPQIQLRPTDGTCTRAEGGWKCLQKPSAATGEELPICPMSCNGP